MRGQTVHRPGPESVSIIAATSAEADRSIAPERLRRRATCGAASATDAIGTITTVTVAVGTDAAHSLVDQLVTRFASTRWTPVLPGPTSSSEPVPPGPLPQGPRSSPWSRSSAGSWGRPGRGRGAARRDREVLEVLVPPQELLGPHHVLERPDPDLDVPSAERPRSGLERAVTVLVAHRGQHDVHQGPGGSGARPADSARKWRGSRRPSMRMPPDRVDAAQLHRSKHPLVGP